MIPAITNDQKVIRQEFNKLLAAHMKMSATGTPTDEYYKDRELFLIKLGAFIRKDMTKLTTNQLLHVCSMVGTYRPVALHTFLIYLAKLVND